MSRLASILMLTTVLAAPLVYGQEPEAPAKPQLFERYPQAPCLAVVEVDLSRASLDALATTALGFVAKDPEVVKFLAMVKARFSARFDEIRELGDMAERLNAEQDSMQALEEVLWGLTDHLPFAARAYLLAPATGETEPRGMIALAFEERSIEPLKAAWKTLREESNQLAGEVSWTEAGEVEGQPILQARLPESQGSTEVWAVMLGRELWVGIDAPNGAALLKKGADPVVAPLNTLGATTHRLAGFSVDVARILAIAKEEGDEEDRPRVDRAMKTLGLEGLSTIRWTAAVDGANLRETTHLALPNGPKGLLGGFVPSTSSEPTPPLPLALRTPMLRVDGRMDPKAVLEALTELVRTSNDAGTSEVPLDQIPTEKLKAAFTGTYALAVGKPTLLSPVPKVAFAIGLADAGVYSELFDLAKEKLEGVLFETSSEGEFELVTMLVPNAPANIAPTFLVRGNVLYVADSPKTGKALIRSLALGKDLEGMADLPPVMPFAGTNATVTIGYDVKEVFKLLYGQVMTMVQMGLQMASLDLGAPVVALSDLPPPSVIASYMTPGSGGAAWRDDGLWVSTSSPMGNPLIVAASSLAAPMGVWAAGLGVTNGISEMRKTVAGLRAQRLVEGLTAWRTSFGGGQGWPKSLGELAQRALIEDSSIFLSPSDDKPLTVEYQDTAGAFQKLSTSWTYIPQSKLVVPASAFENLSADFIPTGPADIMGMISPPMKHLHGDSSAKDRTILLHEHRDLQHGGRVVVFDDGSIYHVSEKRFAEFLALSR